MEEYVLKIKTNSRYRYAGTDATVQVKITGQEDYSTSWNNLDYFWVDDFEAGSEREYTVKHMGEPGIGIPLILSFRLTGTYYDKEWNCDMVTVKYKNAVYPFPVFRWIRDQKVSIARGDGVLPQNIHSAKLLKLRRKEIDARKLILPWNPKPTSPEELGWGICRFLGVKKDVGLPALYSNTHGQTSRLNSLSLAAAINAGMNLFSIIFPINELDDYRKLYIGTGYEDPPFIHDWKKDTEFGRQVLTGISPLGFKRCVAIPNYFNVTEHLVANYLEKGKSLTEEMKDGKIYIADYSYTSNIERNTIPLKNQKLACADCVGLFYANQAGDFIPLAIQLVPSDETSLFTPADKEYDWLLAKMYFRSTVSVIHEWYYHFLMTHAVSELFSVGTFRNFPHSHPLYKLLTPHLRSVVSINQAARNVLLPSTSLANQAISLNAIDTCRHFFKTFNIGDLDIPNTIASNGLGDREKLKNFFYRDDALDVWDALHTYVSGVIDFYYKQDSDVESDFELQAWAADLAHEGLGWQDGNTRGMPEKIRTKKELIKICTIIIFASTAQHAAVNFGQMETYQFVPNASAGMVLPPHRRGEANLQRVLDSLPGVLIGTVLVTFAYALSQYASDEAFLGDVVEELFTEDEVVKMQKDFKASLNKLNEKFTARNKSLKYPYWYLLPPKIPIDINI